MMGRCCHSTCEMGVACWALLDGLCAIMGCDGHSGSAQIGTVVICLTALLPYLEGWCKNSPLVIGEQWHPCLSHPRLFVQEVYTTTQFQNIALPQYVPIIYRPPSREAWCFYFPGGCPSLDVTVMMLRKRTFKNVRTARNVRTSADAALRYAAPQVRRVQRTRAGWRLGRRCCWQCEKRQSHYFSSCLFSLECRTKMNHYSEISKYQEHRIMQLKYVHSSKPQPLSQFLFLLSH